MGKLNQVARGSLGRLLQNQAPVDPTLLRPKDFGDYARGQVSGPLGMVGDIENMVRPFQLVQTRNQLLPTSNEVGQRIGADVGSGAFQAGVMTSVDPLSKIGLVGKGLMAAMPALARVRSLSKARWLDNYTPAPKGNLTDAERLIESRFAQQISGDIDGAIARYNEIPDTKGGKIVSVDEARKLDADFSNDGSLSAAVHEPASALSKEIWARKLAERPQTGAVMMMSGGTGAGKTTSLKIIGEDFDVIFDSNLANFEKARNKIEEALKTGRDVDIVHVWRDPLESFAGEGGSAISRANRTGRTVPITEHVKTHVGANKVAKELADFYADDPRVDVMVIDNSHGRSAARKADLSVIQDIDAEDLLRNVSEELEKARRTGRISESSYEGFKGRAQAQDP